MQSFALFSSALGNVNGCSTLNLEARGLGVVSLDRALKGEADRVKTGCRWHFFWNGYVITVFDFLVFEKVVLIEICARQGVQHWIALDKLSRIGY